MQFYALSYIRTRAVKQLIFLYFLIVLIAAINFLIAF